MKLRPNILVLIGIGYVVIGGIVIAQAASGASVSDAVTVVKEPLMALVGGSLALAKDLIE